MHFISLVSPLLVAATASALLNPSLPTYYGFLRIEGETKTLYDGPFAFDLSNVTTKSGGTHHCDGTYANSREKSGPTATKALDSVARGELGWDG
jgi:hypothetical protein